MLMRSDLRVSQTTVEYLVLVAVLLLVFLSALGSSNGALRTAIERYVNALGGVISDTIQ